MEKTKAFNIENGFHFYAIIPAFINRGLQSLLQFPNRKFYSKNTEKKIYSKQIINRFNRTRFNIYVLSLLHPHKLLFFMRNKIFIKYTGLFLSKLTRILPFLTRILLKFLIRMKSLGEEQIAKYEVRRLHGKISNEIEEWLFRITSFRNPLRVLRVRLTHESICICSHI